MAYGLKYTSSAYGLSAVQWKIELYEKDYTPAIGSTPTTLTLVGDGIKIGYDRNDDRFTTIYSRYAIIDFKATTSFDINTLQFDDEKKYQVKIYRNNSLEFIGWLIPFYSSQEFEDISIAKISVQAKDGINQLRNKKFVDQHPEIATNRQSQKDIISQCLREIGYNMTLEVYYNRFESSMNKTSDDCPLAQTDFNIYSLEKDESTNLDYYETLDRILRSHDLRISQAQGVWRVISQAEILDGAVTGRVYDYLGEYVSTETLNTDKQFHTGGLKVKSNSIIRKDIPIQQFSAFYEVGVFTNILPNGKLNQFSGTTPINWTKVGDWNINEVSTILNSNGIQFNNTYTTDEGINGKYFESSEIDITGLSSFKFTAEAYADSDIDSIKIAIILYNSTNSSYKYYVDKYGSIKETSVTAIIDKGTEDKYVKFDLSFITNSATQYLNGVDKVKIRIYPGVRLSSGVPTKKKVKYKNLSLTGQANSYDKEFLGRVYEYKNSALTGSKVADEYTVYYQDNIGASVSKFRNTLFIAGTDSITNAWKRTTEATTRTLLESCLVDRLSLVAKFNDIFEGVVKGYIDLTNTPYLSSETKRFLVLSCEYSLQEDSTEVVLVELDSTEISLTTKIYDRFEGNKTVEVSEGVNSASIKSDESYDKPITSTGGTVYDKLYTDGSIDSLPIDSTDPRATNKGVLVLGPVNAQKIELGNAANQTLIEILGRFGIRTASNYLAEFSTAELTANRVATLPDRNIIVNDYDYIVNKPNLTESWETNWLLKNNEPNLFIGNGEDAISVTLGKTASSIIAKGSFRLGSADEGNLIFSVPSLNDDVTASFPSFAIAVNDWNSLYNKPTSFTPSAHFHQIGDVEGLSTALGNKQDLNPILTALTGLTGNGIVRKTGTSSFVIGTNDAITLSGDVTGIGTTAITTTLANSGVTAGVYTKVTVDAKGRVTNGTNPTTIAGYGITDFNSNWDARWTTKIGAYVSFGASVEVAQNLTVNQDLYVYGALYDTNLEAGTSTQFLRSTNTGFRWTSLTTSYITDFSANVLGQLLTGFTAGSNTPLTSSNTVLTAFQNLDARITANTNNLSSSVSGTVNYIPKFTSISAIGNSTISDNGSIINIGDVAFLQDIVDGRRVNINYPLHIGNSRLYDNTGDDGVNVLVVDTTTLQLDVENVNVIGRLDISENLLSLAKKKYTTSDTWYASIDALYSELVITSSKTSFIGSVGVSVVEGISGANVTANNLWNFSVIPQVTYDATLSNQLVRLSQVQSLLSGGFSVSTTCKLAFNTDQSFTGAKTQGGYTTVTGDSILLVGQSTASQNGVYIFDGTNWTRNTANDTDPEIRGKGHLITNGTFANAQFVNNNSSTITVGTTAITYAQWSGSELDPIFTAHAAYNVTNTKISNWDLAFGWGNHASVGYVKNTGDESIGGIKTFTSELRGTDLRYSGTLKPSGYSPTGAGMVLMSASTTTNYWKSLEISDIPTLQTQLDAKATTDANLVAISALNTNGFIKRTGAGTYAIDANTYLNITGGTMTGALNLVNSVRVGGTGANDDNTYLGKNTLISRTSGTGNSGLGASSLGALTTGSNNTGLGRNAGSSLTTGSYNLFLGSNVGSGITTGSNNVIIGGQVTGLSSSLANNIIIADGAGNRRINVGSTGLVGFGLNSPTYRVDVSGDVNVTGKYYLNGSFGADHQFLKSNGTTQEWATLNVGEISDIATTYLSLSSAADYALKADAVLYGTFEGERGFKLFHDTAKTDTAALFFANQDTGTVGIHYYGLDSNDAVTQHGIQISGDGFVYHKKLNGSKARFLTTDDSLSGGGGTVYTLAEPLYFNGNQINVRTASASQNGVLTSTKFSEFESKLGQGSTVSTFLNFASSKTLYFGYVSNSVYDARIYQAPGDSSWQFQSETSHIRISTQGTGKDISLSALDGNVKFVGKKYFFTKNYPSASVDIEIDMSGFATGKVLKATSSTKAEWVTL